MFCNKCGNKLSENEKFCNKCGEPVKFDMGSIIFSRENKFYGAIVDINIFMDGILVARVGNGKEVKVPVTIGKHRIAFDVWSGNSQEEIVITPEHPNIKVMFTLKMGAVTSKPKITQIINL